MPLSPGILQDGMLVKITPKWNNVKYPPCQVLLSLFEKKFCTLLFTKYPYPQTLLDCTSSLVDLGTGRLKFIAFFLDRHPSRPRYVQYILSTYFSRDNPTPYSYAEYIGELTDAERECGIAQSPHMRWGTVGMDLKALNAQLIPSGFSVLVLEALLQDDKA